MKDDQWTDVVTTTAEFNAAIKQLLIAAEQNDINPRGSWVCDSEDDLRANFEIVIIELG